MEGYRPMPGIDEDRTIELSPEDMLGGKKVRSREERARRGRGFEVGSPSLSGGGSGEEKLVGNTLGGFRIISNLGEGAVGVVYLAEQIALKRLVALKVLSGVRAANREYLARFIREAHAVAQLVHPNAVQVYDIGESKGHHYIALEYVDGETLSDLLERRWRLPWRAALEIVRQAALSIERGHEMGIIHRDIKPENLMLSRRGEVKLTDFGLARLDNDPAITSHGTILGTPLYMSPEQARGEQAGPAADLYSLGATLYHMLVGQPPFDGKTAMEVVQEHISEPPRPPAELVPGLPVPVSELVLKLLAKEPENRPVSACALIKEIGHVRLDAGVAAGVEAETKPAPSRKTRKAGVPAATGKGASQAAVIRAIRLTRDEIQELLAYEATCACLTPRPSRAFLEATMRNYGIPVQKMLPLMRKKFFTRGDVWQLQIQKRSAGRNHQALNVINRLRRLEADLGTSVLRAYVDAQGTGGKPRSARGLALQ